MTDILDILSRRVSLERSRANCLIIGLLTSTMRIRGAHVVSTKFCFKTMAGNMKIW